MIRIKKGPTLAVFFISLLVVANSALAADIDIAPHKALYSFKLLSTAPSAGLDDVSGKMYFEQDSTCEAWTTEHRLTTVYQYADGMPVSDADRYVSFETKDGRQFNFNADGQENGEETEQLRGFVERDAKGGGKAVYSRPEGITYDLPAGYLLPTAYTMEVIRRARAGEKFFTSVMFDGTDVGGAVEIGTFIGKAATTEELKTISRRSGKIDAALMTPEAWHIRMAVFPLSEIAESLPAYEMAATLHDNGVISHAVVDYKSFVIEQNLTALEKIPGRKCP